MKSARRHPNKDMLWYPFIKPVKSESLFRFYHFLYHFIPGCIFDVIMWLKKSKARLLPMYSKLFTQMMLVSYFSTQEWKFHDDNKFKLFNSMTEADHSAFPVVTTQQKYKDIYNVITWSVSKFVFKHTDEEILQSKTKLKKMFALHYSCIALLCSLLIYAFYRVVTETIKF